MAWRRPGDKPLSEPIMVSLLTQRPIVTSHCLHVHFSQKRQHSVYRCLLNLVWPVCHYKHACVSAYTWRHKFGSYTRLNCISIKRLMASTISVSIAAVCTTNKSVGQDIFCGLLELDLAFSSVSCRIKSWDRLCLKEVLEYFFNNISLNDTLFVFLMCLLFSPCRLNKMKNIDFFGDSVSHASFI